VPAGGRRGWYRETNRVRQGQFAPSTLLGVQKIKQPRRCENADAAIQDALLPAPRTRFQTGETRFEPPAMHTNPLPNRFPLSVSAKNTAAAAPDGRAHHTAFLSCILSTFLCWIVLRCAVWCGVLLLRRRQNHQVLAASLFRVTRSSILRLCDATLSRAHFLRLHLHLPNRFSETHSYLLPSSPHHQLGTLTKNDQNRQKDGHHGGALREQAAQPHDELGRQDAR
jgi:hypothetical protein